MDPSRISIDQNFNIIVNFMPFQQPDGTRRLVSHQIQDRLVKHFRGGFAKNLFNNDINFFHRSRFINHYDSIGNRIKDII